MKLKGLTALFTILVNFPVFAQVSIKDIQCSVDTNGALRASLDVKPGFNTQYPEKFDYNGYAVIVAFYAGTQFEPQQALTMELNGYQTKVYDPKRSLYVLEAPSGVKIQCYIQ